VQVNRIHSASLTGNRKEIEQLKAKEKKIKTVAIAVPELVDSLVPLYTHSTPTFSPSSSLSIDDIFHGSLEGTAIECMKLYYFQIRCKDGWKEKTDCC
jgi:hypothetical protein